MEPKRGGQRQAGMPTDLFGATCPITGCDTGTGTPYETPAFTRREDAARDIGDHMSSAHADALVKQSTVEPNFPA